MIQEFKQLGIDLKSLNQEEQKLKCPNCLKVGKTHYNDLCLAVNIQKGVYYCHKCGWAGNVKTKEMDNLYKIPTKNNLQKLTKEGRAFLNSRGITDEVIDKNKIVSSSNGTMIVFPYFKDGVMVNYKTRGVDGKFFTQAKDAQPIIYNYDRVVNNTKLVICEGEMDSLSWEVAGITTHTSVNMGAPNPTDKNIDGKLKCIDNSYEVFETAKLVYIATDNDENGRILQKELLRRIGSEKCKLVDLSPYKDANEVLLHEGKESLLERLKNALDPKVEGVFTVGDVYESLMDGFHNGVARGTTTYVGDIDDAWTWRLGEVNVWTGYQNEGKSLFLNQLAVIKSSYEGWKFGIFSPENFPINDLINDLVDMYIGKTSDPYYGKLQMSLDEYREGLKFVQDHFFIIYPPKNFTLGAIFDKAKYLVRSKGIRGLIIDPYNTIQHKMLSGEREDLYISRFMSKLKQFAVENNVSLNLVAHQITPRKDETGRYPRPDVNYIKGGSEFANKADNVLMVWRPNRAIDFKDKKVIFGSQKIKKQKLVGIPQEVGDIEFNIFEQRYYFNGSTPLSEIDERRKGNNNVSTPLHNQSEQQEEVVDIE